jgi:hypothetical protein
VAKQASQSPAERELHLVLNAIAASAEDLQEVYNDICIPQSLQGKFEYTSGKVLKARKKPPSAECRAAIEDLAERFRPVTAAGRRVCVDDAYVSDSPIWEGIRQSARRVLDVNLFDENAGGESLGPFVYQGGADRARLRALGHPRHVEQGYMIVGVGSQGIVTLYAARRLGRPAGLP